MALRAATGLKEVAAGQERVTSCGSACFRPLEGLEAPTAGLRKDASYQKYDVAAAFSTLVAPFVKLPEVNIQELLGSISGKAHRINYAERVPDESFCSRAYRPRDGTSRQPARVGAVEVVDVDREKLKSRATAILAEAKRLNEESEKADRLACGVLMGTGLLTAAGIMAGFYVVSGAVFFAGLSVVGGIVTRWSRELEGAKSSF